MKKTLSIVLALIFVVAAFAAIALVPDSAANTDPFKLVAIKVSDAAGYANPYLAVDNAAAFVENQAAYVVIEYNLNGVNADKYKAMNATADAYTTDVTSSTLDLSYSVATVRTQVKAGNGTIYPVDKTFTDATDTFTKIEYKSADVKTVITNSLAAIVQPAKDDVAKYFISFIGVTKPATAGEVKAALKVAGTAFATNSGIADYFFSTEATNATAKTLVVYDSTGTAKYTIVKLGDLTSFRVFSGDAVKKTWAEISPKYLFDYCQDASIFKSVGYSATPADLSAANCAITSAVGFTYDAKLIYLGADNKLGTADDKDLTAAVNDCNAFFGFSFATSNPAVEKSFSDKTAGNPVIVSDTYAYVTAAVDTSDDTDIAPTGDFSANIVIVMAASAVLAAAALAFVAKKARD